MVDYFLQGGGFMWPILISGVIGTAFSVERLFHLLRGNIEVDVFTKEVTETLRGKGVKAAITMCDEATGPVRNIFLSALERIGLGATEAEKAIEARGSKVMSLTWRRVPMPWLNPSSILSVQEI